MAVLKKNAEDVNAWNGTFRLLIKTPQFLSVSQEHIYRRL